MKEYKDSYSEQVLHRIVVENTAPSQCGCEPEATLVYRFLQWCVEQGISPVVREGVVPNTRSVGYYKPDDAKRIISWLDKNLNEPPVPELRYGSTVLTDARYRRIVELMLEEYADRQVVKRSDVEKHLAHVLEVTVIMTNRLNRLDAHGILATHPGHGMRRVSHEACRRFLAAAAAA